jgi:peroxiredoxin
LAGFTQWVSLVAFAIIGLAGATTLAEYVRDATARTRGPAREPPLQALWSLFGRNRRKYGGYLVHTGVILMALGVVGTRMYAFETELVLSPGEPVPVAGYTVVFEELGGEPADDHLSTWASIAIYRNGDFLTRLEPRMNQYVGFDQTVAVPALHSSLREDLYLVLAGWGDGGAIATFKVIVNPLASFLWFGGLVFLAGGAVAVWPSARAGRVPAPQARRRTLGTTVGLVVGLLVLAAAVVAMWGWGAGFGIEARSAGRPFTGQPAPDFTLELLDGSTLALADLRGQVVVINFWATWCAPCEDEMPDLQLSWDEYQAEGAVFVGIAFDDEEAAVEEMISRFGATYPMALDVGGDISAAYGITGVPETFIVDAQGNVANVYIGPVSAQQLRDALESLLEE